LANAFFISELLPEQLLGLQCYFHYKGTGAANAAAKQEAMSIHFLLASYFLAQKSV
jgi:hypothetical protein